MRAAQPSVGCLAKLAKAFRLAGALVGFTITYLLILGVLSVIFTIVYRKDIAALNKGLRDFKEKM